MEHIIFSHIFSHLDVHNILCDEQHGFRQKRSCEIITQLLLTIQNLTRNLHEGLQTDVLFLDFLKAFDKVDRTLLLHKLEHYGIQGQILLWITDFLSGRQQQVIVEGHNSNPVEVALGVP